MEEIRKFVCKFCNKRYPCGKSLGGHIRTHMTQQSSKNTIANYNPSPQRDDIDPARKKRKKKDLSSDYGLRENPGKTTRFVHSNSNSTLLHKEKFCKECGKGFPSLKALCGHMACHSEKEKQKLAMMDTQSDTETSDPEDSKRMRFMTLNNHNNPTSSSVSEVEQEQEEEVAMCLMLLSKDFSSHRGHFALAAESNSDNNSAVLEAKSPSVDTRIGTNNGKNKNSNSVYNASELAKVRKDKMKLDSGYFRYGCKKVDSNVSIDGLSRNDVFNRSQVEDRYGFKDYDVSESRKMMNNKCCRSRNTESKKLVSESFDCAKFDSFKRAKNDYPSSNLDEVSCKKKKNDFPDDEIYKNGSNDSESYASDDKSADSTDSDSFPSSSQKPESSKSNKAKKKVKSKRRKEHECLICNKTFRSGQALGGHKRSHFVGGFKENNTGIIKQDSPSPSLSPSTAAPCLIDLNQPAPVDE